ANAEAQLVSADPLTVVVDTADVDRFAKLWEKTSGHPTAAAIESDYIRGAGTGLKLFIPIRHVSAVSIHEQIEAHNEFYREAIDKCLPWAKASTADLRSIYLGLRGLLPERPLPQIYVVIGRASGGGTAVPGA